MNVSLSIFPRLSRTNPHPDVRPLGSPWMYSILHKVLFPPSSSARLGTRLLFTFKTSGLRTMVDPHHQVSGSPLLNGRYHKTKYLGASKKQGWGSPRYATAITLKGTMSAGAHAQYSPVETNLHKTRRGIFAFPPLQKLSKISQQTASVIAKEPFINKKFS